MLYSRRSLRGQSMGIAVTKMIGTALVSIAFTVHPLEHAHSVLLRRRGLRGRPGCVCTGAGTGRTRTRVRTGLAGHDGPLRARHTGSRQPGQLSSCPLTGTP